VSALSSASPRRPEIPALPPRDLPAPLTAPEAPESVLTKEILVPAAVVVLGAVMTILDATIVNVALPVLGRDLHTTISTVQWMPIIYLLAFASVIPLSGWAAGRFGTKQVWLASLVTFMCGSLLAGLSPSVSALIGARVVQPRCFPATGKQPRQVGRACARAQAKELTTVAKAGNVPTNRPSGRGAQAAAFRLINVLTPVFA
jgi:MFS family permease